MKTVTFSEAELAAIDAAVAAAPPLTTEQITTLRRIALSHALPSHRDVRVLAIPAPESRRAA